MRNSLSDLCAGLKNNCRFCLILGPLFFCCSYFPIEHIDDGAKVVCFSATAISSIYSCQHHLPASQLLCIHPAKLFLLLCYLLPPFFWFSNKKWSKSCCWKKVFLFALAKKRDRNPVQFELVWLMCKQQPTTSQKRHFMQKGKCFAAMLGLSFSLTSTQKPLHSGQYSRRNDDKSVKMATFIFHCADFYISKNAFFGFGEGMTHPWTIIIGFFYDQIRAH